MPCNRRKMKTLLFVFLFCGFIHATLYTKWTDWGYAGSTLSFKAQGSVGPWAHMYDGHCTGDNKNNFCYPTHQVSGYTDLLAVKNFASIEDTRFIERALQIRLSYTYTNGNTYYSLRDLQVFDTSKPLNESLSSGLVPNTLVYMGGGSLTCCSHFQFDVQIPQENLPLGSSAGVAFGFQHTNGSPSSYIRIHTIEKKILYGSVSLVHSITPSVIILSHENDYKTPYTHITVKGSSFYYMGNETTTQSVICRFVDGIETIGEILSPTDVQCPLPALLPHQNNLQLSFDDGVLYTELSETTKLLVYMTLENEDSTTTDLISIHETTTTHYNSDLERFCGDEETVQCVYTNNQLDQVVLRYNQKTSSDNKTSIFFELEDRQEGVLHLDNVVYYSQSIRSVVVDGKLSFGKSLDIIVGDVYTLTSLLDVWVVFFESRKFTQLPQIISLNGWAEESGIDVTTMYSPLGEYFMIKFSSSVFGGGEFGHAVEPFDDSSSSQRNKTKGVNMRGVALAFLIIGMFLVGGICALGLLVICLRRYYKKRGTYTIETDPLIYLKHSASREEDTKKRAYTDEENTLCSTDADSGDDDDDDNLYTDYTKRKRDDEIQMDNLATTIIEIDDDSSTSVILM